MEIFSAKKKIKVLYNKASERLKTQPVSKNFWARDSFFIPVQEAVRKGGGNNSAAIQTTDRGAPAIVCGVPVRYCHSPNCISAEYDLEMAVQMVMALLTTITETDIRSF